MAFLSPGQGKGITQAPVGFHRCRSFGLHWQQTGLPDRQGGKYPMAAPDQGKGHPETFRPIDEPMWSCRIGGDQKSPPPGLAPGQAPDQVQGRL